jgi:hypothetical protein
LIIDIQQEIGKGVLYMKKTGSTRISNKIPLILGIGVTIAAIVNLVLEKRYLFKVLLMVCGIVIIFESQKTKLKSKYNPKLVNFISHFLLAVMIVMLAMMLLQRYSII